MEKQEIIKKSELLKAISNPIRLCLVQKLCQYEVCNVTYFTNCMDVSQSAISQHLSKLRDLGIVGYKKEGQVVNYFIQNEEVKEIIKLLFKGENENE